MRFTLAISLILLGTLTAIAQETYESKILEQKDSPIVIEKYQSAYQRGSSTYAREGIHHSVTYRNNTDRIIVAIQFGLVAFDIWNEFLDRTGGVSMDAVKPGGKESGAWTANAYGDFSFHTGVAYVSKVRFDNGEIWTADLEAVARQMREIEKDFDIKNLRKKEEPQTKP